MDPHNGGGDIGRGGTNDSNFGHNDPFQNASRPLQPSAGPFLTHPAIPAINRAPPTAMHPYLPLQQSQRMGFQGSIQNQPLPQPPQRTAYVLHPNLPQPHGYPSLAPGPRISPTGTTQNGAFGEVPGGRKMPPMSQSPQMNNVPFHGKNHQTPGHAFGVGHNSGHTPRHSPVPPGHVARHSPVEGMQHMGYGTSSNSYAAASDAVRATLTGATNGAGANGGVLNNAVPFVPNTASSVVRLANIDGVKHANGVGNHVNRVGNTGWANSAGPSVGTGANASSNGEVKSGMGKGRNSENVGEAPVKQNQNQMPRGAEIRGEVLKPPNLAGADRKPSEVTGNGKTVAPINVTSKGADSINASLPSTNFPQQQIRLTPAPTSNERSVVSTQKKPPPNERPTPFSQPASTPSNLSNSTNVATGPTQKSPPNPDANISNAQPSNKASTMGNSKKKKPSKSGQLPAKKSERAQKSHHPDLPFLVTHWIANYSPSATDTKQSAIVSGEKQAKDRALACIRRAANDLAWAFETLGEFGSSSNSSAISTGSNTQSNSSQDRPTTYSDLTRKYGPLLTTPLSPPSNKFKAGRSSSQNVTILDSLVRAASSATTEASRNVLEKKQPWSFLEAAFEGSVPALGEQCDTNYDSNTAAATSTSQRKKNDKKGLGVGRRVGDSTGDETDQSLELLASHGDLLGSAINRPVLLGRLENDEGHKDKSQNSISDRENSEEIEGDNRLTLSLASNNKTAAISAACAWREFNVLRKKVLDQKEVIDHVKEALTLAMHRAEKKNPALTAGTTNTESDPQRVVAQLQRRLKGLEIQYTRTVKEMVQSNGKAKSSMKDYSSVRRCYQDPHNSFTSLRIANFGASFPKSVGLGPNSHISGNNKFALTTVLPRQYHNVHPGEAKSDALMSILKSRMSHAVTINCHLVYPVYCLRFDRTGKYFITGADDQIVKLFHIGVGPKRSDNGVEYSRAPSFNYGANMRGAVLVCSLRGHAGVISDIDVSADNGLLATASMDGDVRVWGLRDGCPIAILRGHKEGANMVSWSTLTPFRLVTCGEDALAKMWDIREAALKRYGDVIGSRSDYLLPGMKSSKDEETKDENLDLESQQTKPNTNSLISNDSVSGNHNQEENSSGPIPPVPNAGNNAGSNGAVIPPPLPPEVGGIGFHGNNDGILNNSNRASQRNRENVGNRTNPGEFVANDLIDEGVTLVAQLQHGAWVDENQFQGLGTRSSRKKVKVMCITRCPIGGHFATGSDDGLGRVWADEDDIYIEKSDFDLRENKRDDLKVESLFVRSKATARQKAVQPPINAPLKERLLAVLPGHNNAITDMKYSSAGDRILTASMKDGVVRIWSWGKESAITVEGSSTYSTISDSKSTKLSNLSQLLIRLTPVCQGESTSTGFGHSSKRKGSASSSKNSQPVQCDGVTWTCDDMKIVTSQSSPLKATGNEIVPGSHMVYVWESRSGRCLMGILSSHSSLCSTLVSHPHLPSVVATAGSDGVVNVWDLDRGDCFYTHTNLLLHGPAEPVTDRGKHCGFLDGQFSPDGLQLVLTDENGRVTIFDTMVPGHLLSKRNSPDGGHLTGSDEHDLSESMAVPGWMNEQYFANDYYDLFYDEHGYCIERGSEQPPHLAPKGVRCSHDGQAIEEDVRETFLALAGPFPQSEDVVRWERDEIRVRSNEVRAESGVLSQNVRKKTTIMAESPGVLEGCKRTAIISLDGKLIRTGEETKRLAFENNNATPASTSTGRALSDRYRWIGYEDIMDEEIELEDSNDEDYRGLGRRIAQADDQSSDEEVNVTSQPRRRTQQGPRQRDRQPRQEVQVENLESADDSGHQIQPTRSSTRRPARRTYNEMESDDEELQEMISTHNTPSGEFKNDWDVATHIFKMPRGSQVQRKWVTRTNHQGSILGKKLYCPQVGDSVVYIPRAHYDTVQKFPTGYTSPWKVWPTDFPWPVVKCKVSHVRYRFPYSAYYNQSLRNGEQLRGVAIILTLDITHKPYQLSESDFPWPQVFVSARTRSQDLQFEVTMFECYEEDFIIPEYLYTWRLQMLQDAISENNGNVEGINLAVNLPDDQGNYRANEDVSYKTSYCQLTGLAENDEDEFHFQKSGCNSLQIKWLDDDGEDDTLCVWNATVKGSASKIPEVPSMCPETIKAVTAALDKVMKMDERIRECFYHPVDTSRYTDYLHLIEVPMYISFIQKRLKSNYYTNKYSVVSDMDLIKENCYKYNEDGNGLYALAYRMVDEFRSLVDDIRESAPTGSGVSGTKTRPTKSSPAKQPVRLRLRVTRPENAGRSNKSSLENLPSNDTPENNNPSRRTRFRAKAHQPKSDESEHSDGSGEESVSEASYRGSTGRKNSTRQSPNLGSATKTRSSHNENEGRKKPRIQSPKVHSANKPRVTRQDQESHPRQSRARKQLTYAEPSDEEDSYLEELDSESEQSDDASTPKKARGRPRKQTNQKNKPDSVSSKKKRTRGQSKIDYDDSSDESDSDCYSPEVKRGRGVKKETAKSTTKGGGYLYYPTLPKWPNITQSKIGKVGRAILTALRELDERNLFAQPVYEEYPEIADDYLRRVKEPMDFRTIEQERLPRYESIADMQDDLILTFRNCCVYNGEKSEYYHYAVNIWESLSDVFKQVCEDNQVLLHGRAWG